MKTPKSRRIEAFKDSILRLFCFQKGINHARLISEEKQTSYLFTIPRQLQRWKNLLPPSDLAGPL
jgi:hypothetical protein